MDRPRIPAAIQIIKIVGLLNLLFGSLGGAFFMVTSLAASDTTQSARILGFAIGLGIIFAAVFTWALLQAVAYIGETVATLLWLALGDPAQVVYDENYQEEDYQDDTEIRAVLGEQPLRVKPRKAVR